MSTTLKVLSAKKVIASHEINRGEALIIEAREKSNYQLINDQTGLAPQNIIAKREGKDLKLFLEDGDMSEDIIIKNYYGDENSEETSNLVVGQHENGGIYAYVPESGLKSDAVSMLAEQVAAPQALGGEDLGSAFWAFNPWWLLALVPLAAGIAIAAHDSGGSGSNNNNNNVNTDTAADSPKLTPENNGSVKVKPGADNTKVEIKYTDEDGNEKTATVTKDSKGNWTSDDPNVIVNDDTFTIPADKVKDGSTVIAEGTDDAGNKAKVSDKAKSDPSIEPQPQPQPQPQDTSADKPVLTPENNGSVKVKPGADNTKVEIKYTDEDGNEKTATVTKDNNGNWTSADPNVVINNDDTFTIPADKVKDGEPVNAKGTNEAGCTADADAVNAGTNNDPADKPTITSPDNDGKVTVEPGADNNKVEVTFKDEDGNDKTVVAEKQADGSWKVTNDDGTGATVEDGKVVIPADKVKDGEPVNAKGTNEAGSTADADAVNAGTNNDPADKPTITSPDNDGKVTVEPGADNNKVEVTFKDEDGNDKTVVAEKQADGSWKVTNDDGTGATVEDGKVVIPADKVKDGEPVNAKGTNEAGSTADADAVNAGTNNDPADKPTITSPDNDGKVTVEPGADNNKVEVTFKDEDGNDKTVVAEKQADGSWKVTNDDGTGATVEDGKVVIPADKVKDGEPVNAKGTNEAGSTADADAVNAGTNNDPADKPTITSPDNDGKVTVEPGADNNKVEVTFKDEDGNDKTVVAEKQADGSWKVTNDDGTGATVEDGKVVIPADKVKDGEPVNAKGTNEAGSTADADAVNAGTNNDPADKPTITSPDNDGKVTVEPGADNNKVEVTFKDEDGNDKTVVAEKQADGSWKVTNDDGTGATVEDGKVVIPADKVKDGEPVNAKGTNEAGSTADADAVNAGTNNDPADKPTITSPDNDGKVTVEPGADNNKVEVTFKDEDGNDKTVVAEKQADGSWKVTNDDGTGATVEDGKVVIPADKVKDGEPVNAKGTNEAGSTADADAVNAGTNNDPADKPTITSPDNDGKVTVEPGADNNKVEVTFKDEDGNDKTVVAEKQADGSWKVTNDDGTGATVEDGKVVIPADKVKDGEPVNAKGTNEAGSTADADAVNAGTNNDPADKPTITSPDNDGKVTVEPGADNNKVEVTFKDEDGNDKTVVAEKQADGSWKVTNDDGTGATVEDGKVVIPADKVKDGEPVNAKGTNEAGSTADADAVNAGTNNDPADKPTITSPDNDGKVTVEPGADNNKVEVTFKDEDGNDKTVVAEKQADGSWKVTNDDGTGATVEDGKVVIPADKVKDGEPVNAKGTNEAGSTADADAVNAGTNNDPADKPTITSPDNDGKVTVEPGADNNKVEVTFKDEDGNDKTVVAEKQADGSWKVTNDDGTGATVEDGKVVIPADKVKDGEPVNAKGTNEAGSTADADAVNAGTNNDPADKPTITSPDNDGKVTVEPGADNNKVEVTFKDEDGNDKTVVAEKQADGSWKVTNDDGTGATVEDGKVVIPADKVKDGEPVNAKGTNEAGSTADADAVNAGTNNDPADKPTITSPDNDGKVTVEPGADNNKVEVTFKDEDGNDKTVVAEKQADGSWKVTNDDGTGATVEDGKVVIPADKVKDGEPVNAKGTNEAGSTADADAVNAGTDLEYKYTAPDVVANDDGSVTITPKESDATSMTITYIAQDGSGEKTVTVTKQTDLTDPANPVEYWTINDPLVSINASTGEVIIPANVVQDNSDVKATETNGTDTSEEAKATALPDPIPPTISTEVKDNLADDTTDAASILQSLDSNDPALPSYIGTVGSNGLKIDVSTTEKLQAIKSLADGLTNDNTPDVTFTLDTALNSTHTIKFYRVQVEQQMVDQLDDNGNVISGSDKVLQETVFNRVEMTATPSSDGLNYKLNTDNLPETYGTQYRYIAEVTDRDGNVVQTTSQDIYLDTLVDSMEVTSTTAGPQSGSISAMTFSVSKRSEVGATIRIKYNDMAGTPQTVTATDNGDGTYTVDFSQSGLFNRYDTTGMQVEVIDAAGNISTTKTMMLRNLFSNMDETTGPDPATPNRFNVDTIANVAIRQQTNANGFKFTEGNDHLIVGLGEYEGRTVNGNMASMVGGGQLNVNTGAGDDHIQLRGNLQTWRGGKLNMGEGNDKLTFNTAEIATGGQYNIDMGEGNNQILINGAVNNGATIVATFGSGNDIVSAKSNLDGSGSSNYNFGDGDNRLEVGGYITRAQTFAFGSGNDVVQVNGNVDAATITLGAGNNLVQVGGRVQAGATITAEDGNDVVVLGQLRGTGSTTVNLGGGDDSLTVDVLAAGFGKAELGDGNDFAKIRLADGGTLDMGAGDDTVEIVTLSRTGVELGDGDDKITISGDISGASYIDGGAGTDTLYLSKAGGDYSMSYIRNVETIDLTATGRQNLDVNLNYLKDSKDTIDKIYIKGTSEDTVDLGANNGINDLTPNLRDTSNGIAGGNVGDWAKAKTEVVDGVAYDVYTYSSQNQGVSDQLVYVQQGVQVI